MRADRAAAVAALLAACAGAGAEPLALTPCRLKGVEHEAQCGHIERALDPARPDGVKLEIHFAVLPALARRKAADPVFFFAGGPGQGAIDLTGALSHRYARMSNRHDLVFIDQRGTGRSAPLKCPDDDERAPPRRLAELVDNARQVPALFDCLAALQKLPHGDLRQYTTTIAMADIDAVRAALGFERIDAIGASYGTRAVLEYMRQFPQQVRRAVLDGVAPADMVLPASASPDNQAALDALFASCAADGGCARRFPALAGQWKALLASLPRDAVVAHPLTGQDEHITVTRELVLSAVRTPLYLPTLAAVLPAAIAAGAHGRFGPLLALSTALLGRGAGGFASGMHFSVVCAEDWPRLAQSSDAPGADFGASFAANYRQLCARWPRGTPPAAFYTLGAAPVATLVFSGGLDPVTPPRHGARVAQALGTKARHVVIPNAGHGVLGMACLRDALLRFIDAEDDEAALKVDTDCAAAVPRPPAFAGIEDAEARP